MLKHEGVSFKWLIYTQIWIYRSIHTLTFCNSTLPLWWLDQNRTASPSATMGYLSLLLQQDSTFWHFWDSRRQLNSRRTFHFLQTYSCSVLIESHRPKMHLRMWCTKKTHSPTWTFQFCVRMSFETFGTAAKVLNLSWEPKQTLIPLVLQLALGIWIALPSSSC